MSLLFEREELERQLATSATEVLETMFFAAVEELRQDSSGSEERARIGAYLDFHGACTGRLALSLEKDAARNLACCFFGEHFEGSQEEDCAAVIAELTNMVCGAMLSHLNRNSIFCLSSPEALSGGEDEHGDVVKLLQLENGLLRLAFSLNRAAGAH